MSTGNMNHTIPVTLDEVFSGTEKTMTMTGKCICECLTQSCSLCGDSGFRVKVFKQLIQIPPGFQITDSVTVPSLKHPGNNLTIGIREKSHDLFEREESNLICKHVLNTSHIFCGKIIDVPHLNGKTYRISIDAPIDVSKKYVVHGLGFPHVQGGYGNLIFQFSCDLHIQDDLLADLQSVFQKYTTEIPIPLTNEIEVTASKQEQTVDSSCVQQ